MTNGNSYYRVTYPQQGVTLLDGGLDNKFEKSLIPDNDSPDCLNVQFDNASVGTRKGSTILNTTSVGTYVCDGLYTRRDDSGAETMVAFHGGSMRAWNVNTFVSIPSATSIFTAGQRVAAAQYLNKLFVGNGGIIPRKYDGTNFTRHGVYPPTNTASYLTNGAGNVPVGTATYKITFLNSFLAESDVSTGVTVSIAASSTVSLTSLPLAPQSWGVQSRRIYRNDTSSGAVYKLLTTISDNTTLTYTDNAASGTSTAPTDNGVPPNFSVCIYHQNRLFVNDPANKNYVWYSSLGAPYTFPSTNFFKVGDAASDLVNGFEIFDNSLVVLCENSQWINYMPSTDNTGWSQIRVRASYGSKSPFGTFKWNDKVCFPALQNTKFVGFATINGDTVEPSSTFLTVSAAGSELNSDKIEPDMFNIQESYLGNISSIVYKNKAYIAVTFGSGNTTNNRIYQFDFSRADLGLKQVFTWGPFSGLNPAQFTIFGGKLYYGSSSLDGSIYQLEASVYNDNGSAINSYFWTKEFAGVPGHENYLKDFRSVKFLADLAGAYYMNLTYLVDSDKGVGTTKQVSLDPQSTLWGTLVWGLGVWGGGKYQKEFEISLGQAFGKRIQFKFDNQNIANQQFKIHRMNFTYNIRGLT